jgi:hypothetical protein
VDPVCGRGGIGAELSDVRRHPWLAVVVLATAFLWSCANWYDLTFAYEPKTWPTTSGVVTDSRVVDTIIGAHVGRFGDFRYHKIERLNLRYQYQVDGHPYAGTEWNRWPLLERRSALHDSKRYPVDAPVTVHYNPRDPATAVIDTSLPTGALTQFVLGMVVALIAVVSLLRARWR